MDTEEACALLTMQEAFPGPPYFPWTDQVLSQLPGELFKDSAKRYIIANLGSYGKIGDTHIGCTSVWEMI